MVDQVTSITVKTKRIFSSSYISGFAGGSLFNDTIRK